VIDTLVSSGAFNGF